MNIKMTTKWTRALVVVLGLVGLAAGSAQAETLMPGDQAGVDSLFFKFMTSENYARTVARRTSEYETALGRKCDEPYDISLQGARIIRPIVTVPEGPLFVGENIPQPAGGVWSSRHQVTRCGSSVLYNSIASIVPNGQLVLRPLVLGNSGMHPLLIQRFKPQVAQLAQIGECDVVFVANTQQGAAAGIDVSQSDGIYETWTIQGCEQIVQLVIRFDPAEEGNGLLPVVEDRTVLN
jgi:hypothetical protein